MGDVDDKTQTPKYLGMLPSRSDEANPTAYDLFLCHGNGDKSLVRELYEFLRNQDYSVFLDREELTPGKSWTPALETALAASQAFAVCIGPASLGPWARSELDFALRRSREDPDFPLIPIVLPGGHESQIERLSLFLPGQHFIDLTSGIGEGREWIRLKELLDGKLAAKGLRRQIPVGEVQQGLRRLQERFFSSLRPFLAGGRLIARQETQKILALLEADETKIVVVHGVAGCGKSGVLLELADKLTETGRPLLPLRLDRHSLRGTLNAFAATELNLPASPGRSLAAVESEALPGVLLLDQLDALRWTGAHSAEAWDVCREMILDALAVSPHIQIVVSCRTFDLQHDPQFRTWKDASKNLREIQVGDLEDEQVREAQRQMVVSLGESRPIDEREVRLLRRVHHLQMWLILYPRLGLPGSLGTRRALMESFWQDRRTRLDDLGIDAGRIDVIETRLVDAMKEGEHLSARLGELRLSGRELDAYQTLQVFQLDSTSNRVSFCHQSYLDYLIALRIGGELSNGTKTILDWLGAREAQSLFRREQLRLVFDELRDREPESYLEHLRALFEAGEQTRFHLRLLCLQFLSQISEPSPAEHRLVFDWLSRAEWRDHVLDEVVSGQVPWFEILDDAGYFERWLAGDDDQLRDAALRMLVFFAEKSGDRVARLLRPYLHASEDWTRRIVWVMQSDPVHDSDALFDLRVELAELGEYTADHFDWAAFAEKDPLRLLRLVCFLLLGSARGLPEGEMRRWTGQSSELEWHQFEKVTSSIFPRELRALAWEVFFRSVVFMARNQDFERDDRLLLSDHTEELQTLKSVIQLLRDLGRSLLEDDWEGLVALGEKLTDEDRRREILFVDNLREGPAISAFADWALNWLMADPWRARLRMTRASSEWLLAGRLIERCSRACSEQTLRRLEEWLLAYREPDLRERYQGFHDWRLEVHPGKSILRKNQYGMTPHALLPRLPPDRISEAAIKRIAELNRKFGTSLNPDDDADVNNQVGWVGSPLGPDVLERMSDHSLLKLVTSGKLSDDSRPARWRWNRDHIQEASLRTIASDFQEAARRDPPRLAKLLIKWPADGHSAFLTAILQGLAHQGNRQQPETESRKPPTQDLLELILSLPSVQALARSPDDFEVAGTLCNILKRHSENLWSDEALEFLVWIAMNHPHPQPGFYPLNSNQGDSEHFNQLESNALNVTRGQAALAIQSLLAKNSTAFPKLRPAIEHLIGDPHPAVRLASLASCLPVLNIDKDQAVEWFVQVLSAGPDQMLISVWVREFFTCVGRSHLSRLLPLFDRMLVSPLPSVASTGAMWVAATFLVLEEVEERFEQCLAGTPEQRLGVAREAAKLLGESRYAGKAKNTLLRLAEDSDERVAREVAASFRQLDLQHITADREAWSRFARSKAFQVRPTYLLTALKRQTGDLLPFSDCLLATGTTFTEELVEAARDHRTGIPAGVSYYLVPLLLRLYEQAKERDQVVHQRCLDIWDRLLERRLVEARNLTHELDRL